MDRNTIRNLLVKAIAEIQHQSGRPEVKLEDEILPFSDIEGFDSLNGEEVTMMLIEDLEFEENLNPFVTDDGKELTIGQIADRLAAVAKQKEKVS
jgi:hypothetical protein